LSKNQADRGVAASIAPVSQGDTIVLIIVLDPSVFCVADDACVKNFRLPALLRCSYLFLALSSNTRANVPEAEKPSRDRSWPVQSLFDLRYDSVREVHNDPSKQETSPPLSSGLVSKVGLS
jgi:hypothetical protein